MAKQEVRAGQCHSDTKSSLCFTDHIATTVRSCSFAFYNIRKIRLFSEQAAQLLVQALVLSRLDYCHALLAGLPASTMKPLQLIQNAAARVVFNEPKKAHVTPLFRKSTYGAQYTFYILQKQQYGSVLFQCLQSVCA